MKKVVVILSILVLMQINAADRRAALRYDFSDPSSIQRSWEFHCAVLLTPRTVFKVENIPSAQNGKALVIEADKASGVLMTDPKVNLRKNPVMRWRWRLVRPLQIPANSAEPDDQAIVIYLGDGTMLSQKSIGYRWEMNTPVGKQKKIKYAGGKECFTREVIRDIFDIDVRIVEVDGQPVILGNTAIDS